SVSEDRTRLRPSICHARSPSVDNIQEGRVHCREEMIVYRRDLGRDACQYLIRAGGPDEYPLTYIDKNELVTEEDANYNIMLELFDRLMDGDGDSFKRWQLSHNTEEQLNNEQMALLIQLEQYSKCVEKT